MNYKLCARCKFRVPSQLKLCQVCGSRKWQSIDESALTDASSGWPDLFKVKLDRLLGKNVPTWQPEMEAQPVRRRRSRTIARLQELQRRELACDRAQEKLEPNTAFVDSQDNEEEILVRKQKIAELSQWFRNYGSDGLLTNHG